jgi:hypothetical protein
MRYGIRASKWSMAVAGVCLAAIGVPAFAADPAAGVVSGTWQLHKDTFYYYGLTSLYSCSSIEDHVKEILLHFGARKDARVSANGCPRGPTEPGRTADVHAEFYTLAVADDAGAPGAVSAQWTPLEMSPRHPYFVGDGDCELVKEMKDFLSKNFSLRALQYTTSCVPHELTINGFSVKAEALKAVPLPKVSALTQN